MVPTCHLWWSLLFSRRAEGCEVITSTLYSPSFPPSIFFSLFFLFCYIVGWRRWRASLPVSVFTGVSVTWTFFWTLMVPFTRRTPLILCLADLQSVFLRLTPSPLSPHPFRLRWPLKREPRTIINMASDPYLDVTRKMSGTGSVQMRVHRGIPCAPFSSSG